MVAEASSFRSSASRRSISRSRPCTLPEGELSMLREIRPAIVLVVTLTLITGVAYPFAITGIAQVIFPYKAQGSLLERDGKVVGSALIELHFTRTKYSHGRRAAP